MKVIFWKCTHNYRNALTLGGGTKALKILFN